MELILSATLTENRFTSLALATVYLVASCWIIQKRLYDLGFDILDEILLNNSRVLPILFSRYQQLLFDAIEHWNIAIRRGVLALQQLNLHTQPLILETMTHPDLLTLKTMLATTVSASGIVLRQSRDFFRLLAHSPQPSNIVNYSDYMNILTELNTRLEVMETTTLESLESIIGTLHLLY